MDMGQPEPPADDVNVAEAFLDLARTSVGDDIEILGALPQHQVPDRAAAKAGDEAHAVKAIKDLEGVGIDVPLRDRVLGPLQDDGFIGPARDVVVIGHQYSDLHVKVRDVAPDWDTKIKESGREVKKR